VQASARAIPESVRSDVLQDRALAGRVLAARSAIRGRILHIAAPETDPTVLLDVLADSLIDHCAEALDAGTWAPLTSWADAVCDQRSDVASVGRVFTAMSPALWWALGRGGFEELAGLLEGVVKKPRIVGGTGTDTIDELDVLLADMVAKVESNDPITAEHCRAVSAWCARIASRLALTRSETTHVARGGLIHDVGKSVTPTEILQAPRKLTDDEWLVMREHVVTGHGMVHEHPKLGEFAGMVRSHHERFDGGGYPDRLERARIPIGVRIVTVADAFNAMIGRRPYRTPMSPDRALAELKRCTGTQFDPNVVGALVEVSAC
jgi:putative nucleotidyltransferase with HDIG domain